MKEFKVKLFLTSLIFLILLLFGLNQQTFARSTVRYIYFGQGNNYVTSQQGIPFISQFNTNYPLLNTYLAEAGNIGNKLSDSLYLGGIKAKKLHFLWYSVWSGYLSKREIGKIRIIFEDPNDPANLNNYREFKINLGENISEWAYDRLKDPPPSHGLAPVGMEWQTTIDSSSPYIARKYYYSIELESLNLHNRRIKAIELWVKYDSIDRESQNLGINIDSLTIEPNVEASDWNYFLVKDFTEIKDEDNNTRTYINFESYPGNGTLSLDGINLVTVNQNNGIAFGSAEISNFYYWYNPFTVTAIYNGVTYTGPQKNIIYSKYPDQKYFSISSTMGGAYALFFTFLYKEFYLIYDKDTKKDVVLSKDSFGYEGFTVDDVIEVRVFHPKDNTWACKYFDSSSPRGDGIDVHGPPRKVGPLDISDLLVEGVNYVTVRYYNIWTDTYSSDPVNLVFRESPSYEPIQLPGFNDFMYRVSSDFRYNFNYIPFYFCRDFTTNSYKASSTQPVQTVNLKGQIAAAVHFMTALYNGELIPTSTKVGELRVYYTDGTFTAKDLIAGENTGNYLVDKQRDEQRKVVPNFWWDLVVDGNNFTEKRMYLTTVSTSLKPVSKVEILYTYNDPNVNLYLTGVTLEKAPEFSFKPLIAGPREKKFLNIGTGELFYFDNIPFRIKKLISSGNKFDLITDRSLANVKQIQYFQGKMERLNDYINLSGLQGSKLYLLHNLVGAFSLPNGTTVARFTVYYTDGTAQTVDFVAGVNTAEWDYENPEKAGACRHSTDLPRQFSFLTRQEANDLYNGHFFYTEIPLDSGKTLNYARISLLTSQGEGANIGFEIQAASLETSLNYNWVPGKKLLAGGTSKIISQTNYSWNSSFPLFLVEKPNGAGALRFDDYLLLNNTYLFSFYKKSRNITLIDPLDVSDIFFKNNLNYFAGKIDDIFPPFYGSTDIYLKEAPFDFDGIWAEFIYPSVLNCYLNTAHPTIVFNVYDNFSGVSTNGINLFVDEVPYLPVINGNRVEQTVTLKGGAPGRPLPGERGNIKVLGYDKASNLSETVISYIYDPVSPVIEDIYNLDGGVTKNSLLTLWFKVYDSIAGLDENKLKFYLNGVPCSYQKKEKNIFEIFHDEFSTGKNTVDIEAYDLAGNFAKVSYNVYFDPVLPVIVSPNDYTSFDQPLIKVVYYGKKTLAELEVLVDGEKAFLSFQGDNEAVFVPREAFEREGEHKITYILRDFSGKEKSCEKTVYYQKILKGDKELVKILGYFHRFDFTGNLTEKVLTAGKEGIIATDNRFGERILIDLLQNSISSGEVVNFAFDGETEKLAVIRKVYGQPGKLYLVDKDRELLIDTVGDKAYLDKVHVDIKDGKVAYVKENADHTCSISIYNLENGQKLNFEQKFTDIHSIALGEKEIYLSFDNYGQYDLGAIDINTGSYRSLRLQSGEQIYPQFSGGYLYYLDTSAYVNEVVCLEPSSGKEEIKLSFIGPARFEVSERGIVFVEYREERYYLNFYSGSKGKVELYRSSNPLLSPVISWPKVVFAEKVEFGSFYIKEVVIFDRKDETYVMGSDDKISFDAGKLKLSGISGAFTPLEVIKVLILEYPDEIVPLSAELRYIVPIYDINVTSQPAQPVKLTIAYQPEKVIGINEDSLAIYYFNPEKGQWEKLDSIVDKQNHTVTAEVTHFSQYTILGTIETSGDKPMPPPTYKKLVVDNGTRYWNEIYLPNERHPENYRIHSNYTKNTDACASCHRTHTAVGKTLLQWFSVYDTCMACHDGTVSTTYNVVAGEIGTTGHPTYGGAFGTGTEEDLSNHNVIGAVNIFAAPGGNITGFFEENDTPDFGKVLAWDLEFGCTSCHNPHGLAGNARILNPNVNNYALLNYKTNIQYIYSGAVGGYVAADGQRYQWLRSYPYLKGTRVKVNGELKVEGRDYTLDSTGGYTVIKFSQPVAGTVTADFYPALVVKMKISNYLQADETIQHVDGLNRFCGACHTDYNNEQSDIAQNTGAGSRLTGTYTEAYRHQVGFKVEDFKGVLSTANLTYEKKENGQEVATCETCHYAHGTNRTFWEKTLIGNVYNNEAKKYWAGFTYNDLKEIAGSSALKRAPNMAVCEVCHQKGSAGEGYLANTGQTILQVTYLKDGVFTLGQKYVGSDRCLECHAKEGWSSFDLTVTVVYHKETGVFEVVYDENFYKAWLSQNALGRAGQKVTVTLKNNTILEITYTITNILPGALKTWNESSMFKNGLMPWEVSYVIGFKKKQAYVYPDGTKQYLTFGDKARFGLVDLQRYGWISYNTRTEVTECFACHVTGWDGNTNSAAARYVEMGVGCEKCHGPGENHVKNPSSLNIVNPLRLSLLRQNDLCGSCHSRGETPEGVNYLINFVPGQSLLDKIYLYTRDGSQINGYETIANPGLFYPDGTVRYHQMEYNDYLQSKMGSSVACNTCHNMHGNGSRLKISKKSICGVCHINNLDIDRYMPYTYQIDGDTGAVLRSHRFMQSFIYPELILNPPVELRY
ncbi:hypothetical protein ciss_01680 [Carboxydothermus islandicus]|uniref:Cytochrome c domain-containing protein n=1 Tax=Carboxydothermus islandicus TaxID=661089 RepID=A0A1L8CZ72_9THEO|nr:cytochrome c3 family protein [Carboxydothermus islandicus]GAV24235.1 hypothetical protein ciss_01680 [Carboxydothermus islandicus]